MAGTLNTKLAKYTCASEWVTHKTSHCESRVYSVLRHSTCVISFSLMSIYNIWDSRPLCQAESRGSEVKPLAKDTQPVDGKTRIHIQEVLQPCPSL